MPHSTSRRFASLPRDNLFTEITAQTLLGGCPTTLGFCGLKMFRKVFRQKKIPGTSRELLAHLKSGLAGMAAKCPSNYWGELFAHAATRANWCSIRSAAA